MTLESNLTAAFQAVGADIKAALSVVPLSRAPAGSVLRCPWNGTAWTYAGAALTARPTSRADIYFDLFGAPTSQADPSWIADGDSRTDI